MMQPEIIIPEPKEVVTHEMWTQVEDAPEETYLVPDKLPNRVLEHIIKLQRYIRNHFLPRCRMERNKHRLTGQTVLYHFRKRVESTETEGDYKYFNI